MYYYCYHLTDIDILPTINSQTVSFTTMIENVQGNYYEVKHNSDLCYIMMIAETT